MIAGYQFVISDEDDASEYLKCVMKKVFDGKLGGHTKIVVAFPDLYLQVSTIYIDIYAMVHVIAITST